MMNKVMFFSIVFDVPSKFNVVHDLFFFDISSCLLFIVMNVVHEKLNVKPLSSFHNKSF